MTCPDPPSGVPEETLRWCSGVALVLGAAAARAGELASGIAADWLDDSGREWAERTALLHRALVREALAAADLSTAQALRIGAGNDPSPPLPASAPGAGAGRDRRARLGGTDAVRAEVDVGMRVAELPEPGAPG